MEPAVRCSKDEVALTADTLTAEVEIKATSSTVVRVGLDLVAVLDMGGRVYGNKMEYMKKAMLLVIEKLTPVDRLCIVTFSDVATRLCPLRCMTPGAQGDLVALVHDLQVADGGGSNIKAGLETGLAVIADRVHTDDRTASIFLFSDGHQTSGEDAKQLRPGHAAIYTFSLGRGTTDHRLMVDIAEKSPFGNGTYLSAHTCSTSPADLTSQLLDSRLLTVVAQDVKITIILTKKGNEKVAPGRNFIQATDPSTGKITIKFGALSAGERRRVVVNLTLKSRPIPIKADSSELQVMLANVFHGFNAQGRKWRSQYENFPVTPSTELGRRQPDDIRQQVKVLTDANDDHQLQLNRLQDELLRQTTSVVHVGSNTFLEQDRNSGKAPPRRRGRREKIVNDPRRRNRVPGLLRELPRQPEL
ncbi:hypothetical protein HU200_066269 [Digitaria exilis]|uniref:VWFA domain-containing protein n=1 Tax=Digitaria exilis TaxID=1010633 RepID=A0A835DTZ4_9POAL|nr:hypothetical protein HU200_066269 [Digitaria exilis]